MDRPLTVSKSFFIFLFIAVIPGDLAEYCSQYPGDIKFVYHQLKDEVRYIQKYGANVLTKYRTQNGYTNGHLYQTGPGPVNVVEEKHGTGGGGSHEKPQGHNESRGGHPAKIASRERLLRDEREKVGHKEEEPNLDKVLPVWKLQLPRNTLSAALIKIDNNGKADDKFDFYKDDFENKNLTSFHGRYSKHIDLTPLSIVLDATYLVCANLHNVFAKKEYICQHCTLITASDKEDQQKSLMAELIEEESRAESVLMKYSVKNMPFPVAMVKTSVMLEKNKNGRCISNSNQEKEQRPAAFESLDPLIKDTVTFVEIRNLLDSYEYSIEVGLELKWADNNPPQGLPSPMIEIRYYLNEEKPEERDKEENLHISKCSSKTSHEIAN